MPRVKKTPYRRRNAAPWQLAFPNQLRRLKSGDPKTNDLLSPKHVDAEVAVMEMWQKMNRRNPNDLGALLPVDAILHQCTSGCQGHEHEMTPLCDRDVMVVNATIQYLATCWGSPMVNFLQVLGYEVRHKSQR